MEGMFTGDGKSPTWASKAVAGPGVDTTAVAKTKDGVWVATRRGLAVLAD